MGLLVRYSSELPNIQEIEAYQFTRTTTIYARDGRTIIGRIQRRSESIGSEIIPVERVSPEALASLIFSEDARFFEHFGFDLKGMVRAAIQVLSNRSSQGGSTITQQVVRN
ncbi:MAG: transglycosylase domain-containing protein, partial [Deinococcus sp.]|nr:transglycosylase domain-containing protein [Deinococcus sp.]